MANHSEPYIEFDEDKFVDVVHYVCQLFKEQPDALGQVKLHKILYFADMTSFFETGQPLTGVEYQKQPLGPTARHLGKALKRLQESGKLKVSKRRVYGYNKADFEVMKPLESNRLTDHEMGLLRAVAEWASGLTAMEISEASHKDPWRSVKQGERIDYATAGQLFPRMGPTDADLKWAQDSAKLIESGQVNVRNLP